MTQKECENLILEKVEEIAKIAREFNPRCYHISMCIIGKSAYVDCSDEDTGEFILNGHNGKFNDDDEEGADE